MRIIKSRDIKKLRRLADDYKMHPITSRNYPFLTVDDIRFVMNEFPRGTHKYLFNDAFDEIIASNDFAKLDAILEYLPLPYIPVYHGKRHHKKIAEYAVRFNMVEEAVREILYYADHYRNAELFEQLYPLLKDKSVLNDHLKVHLKKVWPLVSLEKMGYNFRRRVETVTRFNRMKKSEAQFLVEHGWVFKPLILKDGTVCEVGSIKKMHETVIGFLRGGYWNESLNPRDYVAYIKEEHLSFIHDDTVKKIVLSRGRVTCDAFYDISFTMPY